MCAAFATSLARLHALQLSTMDRHPTPADSFPTLFTMMQRALVMARRIAASGRDKRELGDLLFHSRRLLVVMRQHADLAPADARDSLVDLCNAADQSLRKLEHPAVKHLTIVH